MIIKTFLDNDLYTFTQGQLAYHQYPDVEVEYAFKCRTPGFDFAPYFDRIEMEIRSLHGVHFTNSDISVLARLNLFKPDYLESRKGFCLDPDSQVKLSLEPDGSLNFRMKGKWRDVIHYETPALAIISEVCQAEKDDSLPIAWHNLFKKVGLLRENPVILFEMGTRRRQSKYWQQMVIDVLRQSKLLAGTSNVQLGAQFGIPIIGTVAHQAFQVAQAMAPDLETFLQFFLKTWMNEYPNECRTTLTDIVGYKAFLKALNRETALHYNGYRHDSGDPYVFGDDVIKRLQELEINPKTRLLVFSDGLKINEETFALNRYFKDRIGVNLAIGTDLTNDFAPAFKALSMVIKMVNCDGKPVAKLSDDAGKGMCEDPEYAKRLGEMFPR